MYNILFFRQKKKYSVRGIHKNEKIKTHNQSVWFDCVIVIVVLYVLFGAVAPSSIALLRMLLISFSIFFIRLMVSVKAYRKQFI